jgi:hypothetical protein
MVEFVEDRFGVGRMDAWAAVRSLHKDFASFNRDVVWGCLIAKLDSDPKAEWPPTPPALRAAVLDKLRHSPKPQALPNPQESFGWSEYSKRTYGEVIPLVEAVRRTKE